MRTTFLLPLTSATPQRGQAPVQVVRLLTVPGKAGRLRTPGDTGVTRGETRILSPLNALRGEAIRGRR